MTSQGVAACIQRLFHFLCTNTYSRPNMGSVVRAIDYSRSPLTTCVHHAGKCGIFEWNAVRLRTGYYDWKWGKSNWRGNIIMCSIPYEYLPFKNTRRSSPRFLIDRFNCIPRQYLTLFDSTEIPMQAGQAQIKGWFLTNYATVLPRAGHGRGEVDDGAILLSSLPAFSEGSRVKR